MKPRIVTLALLASALAAFSIATACSALQTAGNPTTQALGEASAVTGAVASTVGVAAPAPWGQILAGVFGAVSVIAGIAAHGAVAKSSAQQVVNAVTTGLTAASQSLSAAAPVPSPATK